MKKRKFEEIRRRVPGVQPARRGVWGRSLPRIPYQRIFGYRFLDWVIWDTGLGLVYLGCRFLDLGYLGYSFWDLVHLGYWFWDLGFFNT